MESEKKSATPKVPSKPTSPNAKRGENVSEGGFQELLKFPRGTRFRFLPAKPTK
jgi:hypothetical protein